MSDHRGGFLRVAAVRKAFEIALHANAGITAGQRQALDRLRRAPRLNVDFSRNAIRHRRQALPSGYDRHGGGVNRHGQD